MLRWSINLFKVFGIQLEVHASFVLLLAYAGYEGWKEDGNQGLLWRLLLIVLFFVCVVLHELGHSLTARRFGIRVPRILLLPIGGMAQLERIPRKPSEELLVTIAGPAVNFLLVAIMTPTTWRVFFGDDEIATYSGAVLICQLWWGNLIMGMFNLLPVFPMDGGRIFRAALATQMSYLRATYCASLTGKILAVLFAVLAFLADWRLTCALFLFIFWAADMEYRHVLRAEEESRFRTDQARRAQSAHRVDESDPPCPPLLLQGPAD